MSWPRPRSPHRAADVGPGRVGVVCRGRSWSPGSAGTARPVFGDARGTVPEGVARGSSGWLACPGPGAGGTRGCGRRRSPRRGASISPCRPARAPPARGQPCARSVESVNLRAERVRWQVTSSTLHITHLCLVPGAPHGPCQQRAPTGSPGPALSGVFGWARARGAEGRRPGARPEGRRGSKWATTVT